MERSNRRTRWWAMPVALVAPALAVSAVSSPAVAQETTPAQTLTFNYTGGPQSWTVPADVHQATFDVYGAQGGKGAFDGGWGGRATDTMVVTPGDVVVIMVGGRGLDHSPPTVECVLITGSGGFNGGGSGGDVSGNDCSGPGGGGASDVRIKGTALSNRVLVAGGGGGGAGNLICNGAGGGGGLTGGAATQNALCSGGGTGGSQDDSSGSGQFGQGGQGADDDVISGPGGGGGGGYYGGGGGAAGLGGGGGSGLGPSETAFQNSVRQGNGLITVAFGSAPTVTGIDPHIGPERGGFLSTITGTNFVRGQTSVMFGAVPSPSVDCVSETTCNVASPPGTGTVSVRVTVNGQQSLDTAADDYTYIGAPTIASISPTAGPEGTVVTIEGTNFFPAPFTTWVQFGSSDPVSATCPSLTRCTVASPPGVGIVDVVVDTQSGESNSVRFTSLPSVTRLAPTGGPAAGNTAVTITGTGFSTAPAGTAVTFGSTAAIAVGCASATTCTAVSPPGAGTVPVRVTVSGLQSPDTPADDFTYAVAGGEPPLPNEAAAQLAALEDAAADLGRAGRGLARLVNRAGQAVEDGRPLVACGLLRGFVVMVRVFGAVGQLTQEQATQFTADATRIRTVLGCR